MIESNPYYFFGYGLIYGIIVQYLHYINFFIIFVITFPLGVIKLSKIDIYKLNLSNSSSKIFILPIVVVNILLSIIDSYIIGKSNSKIKD